MLSDEMIRDYAVALDRASGWDECEDILRRALVEHAAVMGEALAFAISVVESLADDAGDRTPPIASVVSRLRAALVVRP
jgi:hypothetical protein